MINVDKLINTLLIILYKSIYFPIKIEFIWSKYDFGIMSGKFEDKCTKG